MDKAYQLLVDESFKDFTDTIQKTYGAVVTHCYLFQLLMQDYDLSFRVSWCTDTWVVW